MINEYDNSSLDCVEVRPTVSLCLITIVHINFSKNLESFHRQYIFAENLVAHLKQNFSFKLSRLCSIRKFLPFETLILFYTFVWNWSSNIALSLWLIWILKYKL